MIVTDSIPLTAHGRQLRIKRRRNRSLLLVAAILLAGCLAGEWMIFHRGWPSMPIAVPGSAPVAVKLLQPVFYLPALTIALTALMVGKWPAVAVISPVIVGVTTMVVLVLLGVVPYSLLAFFTGRKQCVLYLRKFGMLGPQEVMTRSINNKIGRRYRIIALDDQIFLPIEMPTLEWAATRYIPPILIFCLIALTLYTFERMSIRFAVLEELIVPVTGLLVVVSGTLLLHRRRVRRRSHLTINTRKDIQRCIAYIDSLESWRRAHSSREAASSSWSSLHQHIPSDLSTRT